MTGVKSLTDLAADVQQRPYRRDLSTAVKPHSSFWTRRQDDAPSPHVTL